jgi:hypothetical protein
MPEHITTYCQRLAAMKKGERIALLKGWQVIGIKAYKFKRSSSQHEYVSIAVVDPKNKTSYVAIERGRGQPNPKPSVDPQPVGQFSSSNASLSSLSSFSDFISPTRLADDRISPMLATAREGMWNESDELICEFNIKKLLCLYELAFLALIVHEANTSYLLKTNNCYHYVGTIMKVLAEEYGTLNPVEGAGAGEWCGLVIYSGKEASMGVTLDYLVEGFKNVVKKFVSFVPIISS